MFLTEQAATEEVLIPQEKVDRLPRIEQFPKKTRELLSPDLKHVHKVSDKIQQRTQEILTECKDFLTRHSHLLEELRVLLPAESELNKVEIDDQIIKYTHELRKMNRRFKLWTKFPRLIALESHLPSPGQTTGDRISRAMRGVVNGETRTKIQRENVRAFNSDFYSIFRGVLSLVRYERNLSNQVVDYEEPNGLQVQFENCKAELEKINVGKHNIEYLLKLDIFDLSELDSNSLETRDSEFGLSGSDFKRRLHEELEDLRSLAENIVTNFDQKAQQYIQEKLSAKANATISEYLELTTGLDDIFRPDVTTAYCFEVVEKLVDILKNVQQLSAAIKNDGLLVEKLGKWANNLVYRVGQSEQINNAYSQESIFTHTAQDIGVLNSILMHGGLFSHRAAIEKDIPISFTTGISGETRLTLRNAGVIMEYNGREQLIPWDDPNLTQKLKPFVNQQKPGGVLHEFDQIYFDWDKFYFDGPNRSQWAIVMPSRAIISQFQFSDYNREHGIAIFDKEYDSDGTTPESERNNFPSGIKGSHVDLNQLPFMIIVGDSAYEEVLELLIAHRSHLPQFKDEQSFTEWLELHVLRVKDLRDVRSVQDAQKAMYSRFAVPESAGFRVPTGNKGDGGGSKQGWHLYQYIQT